MTEPWRRRLLYAAGAWNVVGGLSVLLDPPRHFAQLYRGALSLDDPLQAFFFRASWINVIAWGVGYVLAARRPAARGPVLLAGGAGKLLYFAACLALYTSGRGSALLLVSGVLDVAFAAAFVLILSSARSDPGAGGSR
jgi:hypothetical protein